MIHEHNACREYIFKALKTSDCPKKVVITHYLPSFRSIDPRFADSPLNGYFASSLDKLIESQIPKSGYMVILTQAVIIKLDQQEYYVTPYRILACRVEF